MNILRSSLVGVLLIGAVASSFASSIEGKWSGHVDTTSAVAPAGMDARGFASFKEMSAKMKLVLTINANKTYSVTYSSPATPPHTTKGTWTKSGNTINLTDRGVTKALTISPNGRSLVMVPDRKLGIKMTFTR